MIERRLRLVIHALVLSACALACGGPAGPVWRALDASFDPADIEVVEGHDASGFTVLGRSLSVERSGSADNWISVELERDDWELRRPPGLWAARVGMASMGSPREGDAWRLTAGDHVYPFQKLSTLRRDKPLAKGSFQIDRDAVLLSLTRDEEPPAKVRLAAFAGRGFPEASSSPQAKGWRIRGKNYSGRALPVWPGERWSTRVQSDEPALFSFHFALEPAAIGEGAASEEPVVYRVLVDGTELLREELPAGAAGARRHALELPAGELELTLEVSGPPAFSAFFGPRVGPLDFGTYDERPWKEERPNLIVFQADTFRADNLTVYGSTDAVTPNIDAFAKGARVYRRAWSVGTYTLPAHTTMFSGVFPRQAGILGTSRALPESLETIAELLHERGYRTGAVTDSVIVSSNFQMDQGFEWFEEHDIGEKDTIGVTNARVRDFLDADDGRPVFLFIQTYRVHLPYRVSDKTRAQHGERLGIVDDYSRWERRLLSVVDKPPATPEEAQTRAAIFAGLRAHYLGGVVDLDRGFGRFLDDATERGLLASGVLLFTSDHGEAFGEHGVAYHTGPVFEEQTRIPMILAGRGVEAGIVDHAASLVDLAPTLGALAGLAPHPLWMGSSLLELDGERPVFLFECKRKEDSTLGIVHGERKLITYEHPDRLEDGRALAAFELSSDPRERRDLLPETTWPQSFFERFGSQAAILLEPVVGPQAAELDAEKLEELQALGYGGEE